MPSYLACDLGAESGRCILGTLEDGELRLEEIHRFPNVPVRVAGTSRWNLLGLFGELCTGLQKALVAVPTLRSVSVDTWGVDYIWYNANEPMLAPAFCYRDPRGEANFDATVARLGRETIFRETGIQFMPLNTLYQLAADLVDHRALLDSADGFLLTADFLNFLFGGIPVAERSLASTTQLYDPRQHAWSAPLTTALGLPTRLLPRVVASGELIGKVRPDLVPGASEVAVVSTCSHDTGAAVAAVPAAEGHDDWAYLVSGTWSLLGVELPAPLISDEVRTRNFTNEVGHDGTIRFLKNISGLWLLQEARRDYARLGQTFEYASIVEQASVAGPARAFIHPAAARFARPGGMLDKISTYCRETGQTPPETPGEYFRVIFESLALLYRTTLTEAESLTGRTINTLHIVGGGSQNRLLNQFTADATGRSVVVGPVEATAIGNVLIQAIADGRLTSLADLRRVVAHSFPLETLKPEGPQHWHDAAGRFAELRVLS